MKKLYRIFRGKALYVFSIITLLFVAFTALEQQGSEALTPQEVEVLLEVTTLGLYYKWQTFFFIPLGAMQTCIVPIISFNYASKNLERCKKTLETSIVFGLVLMFVGTLCFELIPTQMLRVFSSDELVIEIGRIGFRIIGLSFLPLVTFFIFPVFFQAVGAGLKSSLLTIVRTVFLFVPLGYVFSRFGLNWFWLTYPVTEIITTIVGFVFCYSFFKAESRKIN